MKVLLDENIPHDLRPFLRHHETFTAAYRGWAGLKNDELLDAPPSAAKFNPNGVLTATLSTRGVPSCGWRASPPSAEGWKWLVIISGNTSPTFSIAAPSGGSVLWTFAFLKKSLVGALSSEVGMSTPSAKSDSTAIAAARLNRASEFGRAFAQEFPGLNLRDGLAAVRAFQLEILPPRRPGRRRSERITAVLKDWKRGLRGLKLYEKYIPGYHRLDNWERRGRARALDQAIRKRLRRESPMAYKSSA